MILFSQLINCSRSTGVRTLFEIRECRGYCLGRFLLSMLAVHATLAGAWLSRNRPHIVGMLPVLLCTSTRYFGKRKGHRYVVRGGSATKGQLDLELS